MIDVESGNPTTPDTAGSGSPALPSARVRGWSVNSPPVSGRSDDQDADDTTPLQEQKQSARHQTPSFPNREPQGCSISNWKRWAFLGVAIPAGLLCFGGSTAALIQGRLERHVVANVIAGYCATVAVVMTAHLIWNHMTSFTNPNQQSRIIKVLLMVPIYAIQSWLALRYRAQAVYLTLLRDSYESYVIYSFFNLLLKYLGGSQRCIEVLEEKGTMEHLPPLCFFKPIKLDVRFLKHCRLSLAVYAVTKPLCSFMAMILHKYDLYTEGALMDFTDSFPYLTMIVLVTVTIAFTYLVYFYMATKDALAQHKPMLKFGSVKAIIFVSFWQSVVVAILVKSHMIKATLEWTVLEVSMGLQDFLICLEMMVVAIAHKYIFSHEPYLPSSGQRHEFRPVVIRHAIPNPLDLVEEITDLMSNNPSPVPRDEEEPPPVPIQAGEFDKLS